MKEKITESKNKLGQTFVMKLSDDMFDAVKAGTKTVESRLFDEKRKLVKIGDYIEFVKLSDKSQRIRREVIGIEVGKSFREVFARNFTPMQLGADENMSIDEMADQMYKYYDKEQEKKLGVISFILQEPN